MPKTAPKITFGLYDFDLKLDIADITCNEIQPFIKLDDLKRGNTSYLPYATYEQDFWLLDGGYHFLPEDTSDVHAGLMSLYMSNQLGAFLSNPILTIEFKHSHDIEGLTFHFSGYTNDYCSDLKVFYFDEIDGLIQEENHYPETTYYFTNIPVVGMRKIIIHFRATNRPYRYLRLCAIDYGELIVFEGETIKQASVVEECDPLSAEIRVNAFDTRLYSAAAEFSILNPLGKYALLTQWLPLSVYELIDQQQIFIGRYFLESWKNPSETEIEFHCIDQLGLLDTLTCYGGMFTNVTLENLLAQLLDPLDLPYTIESSLASIQISGWLPVCTYRETLQQIAFVVGATVSCARTGEITINPSRLAGDIAIPTLISKSQKGEGGSVALRPQVTGVEVLGHTYLSTGTPLETILNQTLDPSDYTVIFKAPYHTLAATGATITSSGVNYAVLHVATKGSVTLTGYTYRHIGQSVEISDGTSTHQNIFKVENATLVSPAVAETVAQRLYDYHQQRYMQKLKLYAPVVTVGEGVEVETLYGGSITGIIEKMDTDLALGMVSKVEVVGVANALG